MQSKKSFIALLLCLILASSLAAYSTVSAVDSHPELKAGSYLWQDGNYIKGTVIDKTVEEIKTNFSEETEICDSTGEDVSAESQIATGMKIGTNSTLSFVVMGDNNGDGKITTTDYMRSKKYISGNLPLSGAFFEASDINYDDRINTADYLQLKVYLKGSSELLKMPEAALSVECQPLYKEKVTEKDGTANFAGNVNFSIDYSSTFYGHESAMNRDFAKYGSDYNLAQLSGLRNYEGEITGADLNGDSFQDFIMLKNGTLYIYSSMLLDGGTQTYQPIENMKIKAKKLSDIYVGTTLSLKGAGDINGDGYSDIVFYREPQVIVYYGSADGFNVSYYPLDFTGKLLVGDADGDGCSDIIVANGNNVKSYSVDGNALKLLFDKNVVTAPSEYLDVYAGDVNSDKICDIVYTVQEDLYTIKSFFGRGDGGYGCYEADGDNKNLYATYQLPQTPDKIALIDITGNGACDILNIRGTYSTVYYAFGDPAYDYSLFGMRVNGEYRMYSGARWQDCNIEGSDGDHVLLSTSEDGINWERHIDDPMFYLGWEEGYDDWWTGNTLEPEVLYVDNMYHMYWQCEIHTPAGNYGDRIGYAYSEDGINWTRKTDEPAIVVDEELDFEIGFNHHEILYVPDDPDGKPFWIYTGYHVNNAFYGYVRIRSDRPDRFLFSEREETSGFAQIGNQLAYFEDENGDKVFMRITFNTVVIDNVEYWRPTLFMSRDGLHFTEGENCSLAGVDTTDPKTINNRNMFFFGLITENGTGEILRNEDGSYNVFYLSTNCVSSVAPGIYYADAGVGELTFTISE